MAALTLLAVQRTNSRQHPRVYFTGGQGTAQFFWDVCQHAYMQTLLDPTSMKAQIIAALQTDWHKYYAVNIDDGKSIGYYYAFNSHSIFVQADAYLRLTNDTAFLLSRIEDVPGLLPNDPFITPLRPGSRATCACNMTGQWNPPSLEHPLTFVPRPGIAGQYASIAPQPKLDGWGCANTSVLAGSNASTTGVVMEFWSGKFPGDGVLPWIVDD